MVEAWLTDAAIWIMRTALGKRPPPYVQRM